jgi:MFS family permease
VLSPRFSHARPRSARTLAYLGLVPGADHRASPWAVLRDEKNFRLYFCGSVTSDFGTWLQNTAQVLLAYRLAHSVFAVGLVTFAQFSSPLVLGPWAGVMADRFGGRRTLLGTQILSAVVSAVLAVLDILGALNEWWLVSGAILGGVAFTFALPARNVTVQRLVQPERTRPAYVMDAVSYNIGRMVAPLLTLTVGPRGNDFAWAFVANAASFTVFTVILWWADIHGTAEPKARSRVLAGFSIACEDERVLFLLLMVAAVTIADDPILVLGPALATHLHASPDWAGGFIAALGAGSVLGSLRLANPQPKLRRAAIALAVLAGCMIAFVLAPSILWCTVAAFGAGVSALIANSATRTLLSRQAGPDRVAAVMAVYAIAWAGSKPIASFFDGLLGSHIGLAWTGLILAIPALLLIAVVPVMLAIRRPREPIAQQQLAPQFAGASHGDHLS